MLDTSTTDNTETMDAPNYPVPAGLHIIPDHLIDLRPDSEIDYDLLHPKPTSQDDEKNVWFFWHSGYSQMHPYAKRNIRAWQRRLTKQSWTIRVLDRQPSSPLNVANFLDISDPNTFPQAFLDGTIGGDYAPQHTSDLVRWPLLLRYGGVYADVGMMQIGDLDRLWNHTVGDPASGYEVFSYLAPGGHGRATDPVLSLTNYFLASGKNNPLFSRCHRLLLTLWTGKTSTEGMHASPLLKGLPLMGGNSETNTDNDTTSRELTDYIIQGHVMTMVMSLVDDEGQWNGPKYVAEHVYGLNFMVGSQLINEMTAWDGEKAFRLMSLPLPKEGDVETQDQKQAREIVEGCLQRSFGFKLAHGIILKVIGETLGSLWRKHDGSDIVPETYAAWLRHATTYWNQDDIPAKLDVAVLDPVKRGPLLREE